MERDYALRTLQREAERVLHLAEADHADLAARVPSCPDWDFSDLLRHLGNVYNWVGTIVEGRLLAPPGPEIPRRPDDMSPESWLADRLARILAVLREVPDDADMWYFSAASHGPPAFWWRRQVHETVIHRVDAELACSQPVSALEPELAADTVSELFEVTGFSEPEAEPAGEPEGAGVRQAATSTEAATPAATDVTPAAPDDATRGATDDQAPLVVHLHATDLPGAEWTVDTVARTVTRTHAKGDVALRGTAWALARWCWGRPMAGELEVFGDLETAEAWRRSVVP